MNKTRRANGSWLILQVMTIIIMRLYTIDVETNGGRARAIVALDAAAVEARIGWSASRYFQIEESGALTLTVSAVLHDVSLLVVASPHHLRPFGLSRHTRVYEYIFFIFNNCANSFSAPEDDERLTCVTCTANLATSPEFTLMGVGALEMLGGTRCFVPNDDSVAASATLSRSGLALRGLNDQARLTAELGMRLAGIQCSCFGLSA